MNAPTTTQNAQPRNGVRAPDPSALVRAAGAAPAAPLSFSRGVKRAPSITVVYGRAGVGKTTLAASAPAPVFIDLEGGSLRLDVARVEGVETWAEVFAAVRALIANDYGFKTLVFDTLDRLEWLLWQHLFHEVGNGKGKAVTSIEQVGGGFGKGYQCAVEEFRRLIALLEELRRTRGMGVIFLAHGKIASAINSDAAGADFERWELKVDKRLAGLLLEASDNVFYAHRPAVVMQGGERERVRADLDSTRLLGVEETGGYVAKNRDGLTGTIPMNWRALVAAVKAAQEQRAAAKTAPQTTTDDTIPAEPSATTQTQE